MTEPTWQSSTPTQATRLPMDPVPPEPMTGITWFWWLIRPNPLFGSMEAQLKVWNMRMEREPVERFSRMLKTWTLWQLAGIRQVKVMPPMVSTAGWMTSTFTIELSPKRKSPFFTRCEEVGSKFQDWRLSSIPLAPSMWSIQVWGIRKLPRSFSPMDPMPTPRLNLLSTMLRILLLMAHLPTRKTHPLFTYITMPRIPGALPLGGFSNRRTAWRN